VDASGELGHRRRAVAHLWLSQPTVNVGGVSREDDKGGLVDIVYRAGMGSNGTDSVVFAERRRAERVAQIRAALENSATWGEFRRALPEGEWDDIFQDHYDDAEEESPDDDKPFHSDDVPGYAEGDYPEWLQQVQLDWFPPELIAKYGGDVGSTVLSGPVLDLPAERAEEIAAELRAMGHTVEETDLDIA
jgi:hypothetical protein